MKLEKKTLSGLTTLFLPMSDTYSTTVQLFVKAGSIYETRETNGISHFLEHMFFKGGKKYPTPASVAQAVESFGGMFNAYTGDEIASYYVKCPPQHASKALDVLSDMMIHAQFPQEEMEREKLVVVQEIKMYDDNPQALVSQQWNTRYHGDNPYGRSILWPAENVMSFTREDLFHHQKSLYTKDNMILVIAGKIEHQEKLEEQIAEIFAQLGTSMAGWAQAYTRQLPSEQSSFYEKKTEQNHLIIAAPSFPYADEPRYYAAKILSTILGGNMSSRLFQNIREKQGLCYYVWARHSADSYDGLFMIRAGIDKERFDFWLEKIYEEIETFVSQGITHEELANAKSYLQWKLQMGIESSDEMSEFIGSDFLLYNEVNTLENIMKSYDAVTKEDIEALLPLLAKENLYLYYIK